MPVNPKKLSHLKVPELRAELAARGLNAEGRKNQLLQRLDNYFKDLKESEEAVEKDAPKHVMLTKLPEDLIICVLGWLDIPDLLSMATTSKSIRNLVHGAPECWQAMHQPRSLNFHDFSRKLLSQFSTAVQSLEVRLDYLSPATVSEFPPMPNLTRLHITVAAAAAGANPLACRHAAATRCLCCDLIVALGSLCPRLTRLDYKGYDMCKRGAGDIIRVWPDLEYLRFDGGAYRLADAEILAFLQQLPKLKVLNFARNFTTIMQDSTYQAIVENERARGQMTGLALSSPCRVNKNFLLDFVHFRQLTLLDINMYHHDTELVHLAEIATLKHLKMHGYRMDESDAIRLFNAAKFCLHTLVAKGFNMGSERALEVLAKGQPDLRTFITDRFERFNDPPREWPSACFKYLARLKWLEYLVLDLGPSSNSVWSHVLESIRRQAGHFKSLRYLCLSTVSMFYSSTLPLSPGPFYQVRKKLAGQCVVVRDRSDLKNVSHREAELVRKLPGNRWDPC